MGEFRDKSNRAGKRLASDIRQIGDDEDTEVDGWLHERDGTLINARGKVVCRPGNPA